MPGATSETQIMALDLAGIAVSAGSACSSGKVKPSHVLTAMGVPADEAASAIRVSLGWGTTAADIDRLVDAWAALRRRTPGPASHP
jgi:cysteine desulfurase